jgi:transposase
MKSLPDLDRLSVAEKDDLIRSLFARVQELTGKVAELEGHLAQDSRNSSKPPSLDGYGKPKPKSLRTPGQNPPGGQKGHEGHTLKKAVKEDQKAEQVELV